MDRRCLRGFDPLAHVTSIRADGPVRRSARSPPLMNQLLPKALRVKLEALAYALFRQARAKHAEVVREALGAAVKSATEEKLRSLLRGKGAGKKKRRKNAGTRNSRRRRRFGRPPKPGRAAHEVEPGPRWQQRDVRAVGVLR